MSNEGPSGDELTALQRETDPYRQGGDATIAGQVTLDTPYGKMIAPAGQEVLVSPVTNLHRRAIRGICRREERCAEAGGRAALLRGAHRCERSLQVRRPRSG